MIIANDLHADVQRVAGTTQQSVFMLNRWLLNWLESMLLDRPGEDLLLNGDIFDRFNVSNAVLLRLYSTLLTHGMTGARIVLVRGNHDYSNDTTKMPSIELLYNLLVKVCDVTYIAYKEEAVMEGVWVLPHLKNQDEFSAGLKRMLDVAPKVLFLHCNYDNGFTLESDHSLNLSRDIALEFGKLGTTLILGHEHHIGLPAEDHVVITGNQVPSSIYDCLGLKDKYYHILDSSGKLTAVKSWVLKSGYLEIDCQEDFESVPDHYQFLRITGEVSPEEFPKITRKISDLRKSHGAFVIGSALKIKNAVDGDQLESSMEEIKQFKILPEILSYVKDPKHKAALEGIVMEMEA